MLGLVPGIHALSVSQQARRGWPGQARPWRRHVEVGTIGVREN